jgi:hypothetical protein
MSGLPAFLRGLASAFQHGDTPELPYEYGEQCLGALRDGSLPLEALHK